MKLEKEALAYAKIYVDNLLGVSKIEEVAASEDYMAGYLQGASERDEKLQFVIHQLKQISELANRNRELYSLMIADYTLTRIK